MSIRLLNGDCLEVMKTLPDASVDLIICDLPYGCLTNQNTGGRAGGELSEEKYGKGRFKNNDKTEGCAWDIKIDLTKFWAEAKRLLKNKHCPVIHFCTTKFGYELIKSNEAWFRYDLVWDKKRGVSFLQANKMPMRSHEMMYVFAEAGAEYKRVDISGNFKANCGDKGGGKNRQYGVDRIIRPDNTGKRCVLSVVPVAEEPDHEMMYVFAEAGAEYKRVDISGNFKASGGGCTPGNIYGSAIPTNKKGNNEGKRCVLSVVPVADEEPDHEMLYVFSEQGAAYKRVDIKGDFKANCGLKGRTGARQYGIQGDYKTPDNTGKRCVLSVVPVADEEPDHEMLYVFSEQGAAYKRVDIDEPGKISNKNTNDKFSREKTSMAFTPSSGVRVRNTPDGKRCVVSIIDVKNTSGRGKHPTEKPMDLYKWLLERYLPAGGTVLDPTFGSGNCLFQAHAMGGHAIGIEKDKDFYEKAVARLAAQTPAQNVIEENPTPQVNEVAGSVEDVEQGQGVEHTQKRNKGIRRGKGADGTPRPGPKKGGGKEK